MLNKKVHAPTTKFPLQLPTVNPLISQQSTHQVEATLSRSWNTNLLLHNLQQHFKDSRPTF